MALLLSISTMKLLPRQGCRAGIADTADLAGRCAEKRLEVLCRTGGRPDGALPDRQV